MWWVPEQLYRQSARDTASSLVQFETVSVVGVTQLGGARVIFDIPSGRLFSLAALIISMTPAAGETITRREMRVRDPAKTREYSFFTTEGDVAAGVRSEFLWSSQPILIPAAWQILFRFVQSPNAAAATFDEISMLGWTIPDGGFR